MKASPTGISQSAGPEGIAVFEQNRPVLHGGKYRGFPVPVGIEPFIIDNVKIVALGGIKMLPDIGKDTVA